MWMIVDSGQMRRHAKHESEPTVDKAAALAGSSG